MANVKFIAVSRGLKGIVDYVTNREKTTDRLITGVNCVAQTAVEEFECVKKQFRKTDGRAYYHIVQAFSPDDPVDFETVHQIGLEFAAHFKGYQCLVATHMNTAHKHNHIILNSVNFETGMKFHQSAAEMRMVKEFNNELCLKYGLSITEAKADPFKTPKWKDELKDAIRWAMEHSDTREEFIENMTDMGYGVKWESGQKYITYTTPENIRCRDSKLFDQALLRGNMELYFAMGGAEYLAYRKEMSWEYSDEEPGLDDVVYGTASVFDAMLSGDNDRFHLETLHHSEDEIRMMLRLGKKLQKVVYAVDDDEDRERKHAPAKDLYDASILLGDLLYRERKREQELEDEEGHDENPYHVRRAQQDAEDFDPAYDEEYDEEQDEEFEEEFDDEEFQQYHGFGGMGGMGGM